MSEPLTLADGLVGIFHYTLKNDAGEVMDSSAGYEPMPYLHGEGNVVPGLERALAGRSVGDSFEVSIPPVDGYGEHNGQAPVRVHRRELPPGFKPEKGRPFGLPVGDKQIPVWITDIKGAWIWMDTNNPLAGKTLHFEIEVVDIREATPEEAQHGHPHGLDGPGHH